MFRIIIIVASLIVTGCTIKEQKQIDLYKNYLMLNESVKKSQIKKYRGNYFTPAYLSEVNLNDKKSLYLLNLSGYMGKVKSHFQKIKNNTGCLTVNGVEDSGEPLTFYLEFKNINNSWLVNYFQIQFMESSNKFPLKAICPNELKIN